MEILWSIITTFVVCEFGQQVNNAFGELNDLFDEFDWWAYPMEIQRIVPTVMVITQRPVTIHGFGNLPCIRQLFKKVSIQLITH